MCKKIKKKRSKTKHKNVLLVVVICRQGKRTGEELILIWKCDQHKYASIFTSSLYRPLKNFVKNNASIL